MRQAEKERKKFQTRIPLILDPGEQISKKNAEKFKKLKNNIPSLFLAKTLRQDEIGREGDNRILDPNSAHTRPGEQIPKKNSKKISKIKKQIFFVIFSQNGMRQDEIGRERDKRILDPNSAHTRPRGQNFKKIAKKFKKFKKHLSGIIFRQIGMRQAEKEGKEFYTRIPLKPDPGEKISKKIAKIF